MISILHPSRGRADRSLATCKKWIERAGSQDIEIIISIDSDDPEKEWYQSRNLAALNEKLPLAVRVIEHENKSAVDAINTAAHFSEGNILIVVSDDTDCPEEWATSLIKATEGKKDWIAKCPDGIQDWIITMPVMDRAYYSRFGYIYHPRFKHMFCDTFLTCVADLLGRKIDLEIRFDHNHYSIGKNEKDNISARADATWGDGEAVFLDLVRQNYLLSPDAIVGKITNEVYRGWIAARIPALR